MRLLDLCCGAGGAAMGYFRAGFTDIVGVDLHPQPHYPFQFIRADALTYPLEGFDAIHVSPPCQAFSNAQRIQGRSHPDLVVRLRVRLKASGKPYVIENVVGAPLHQPLTLCGQMFGLDLYRHRIFETSWLMHVPAHAAHDRPQTKMGRPPKPGEILQVVGNFSGVRQAKRAMGIDWMVRDELREAIPPAYTEFIGRQLLRQI